MPRPPSTAERWAAFRVSDGGTMPADPSAFESEVELGTHRLCSLREASGATPQSLRLLPTDGRPTLRGYCRARASA